MRIVIGSFDKSLFRLQKVVEEETEKALKNIGEDIKKQAWDSYNRTGQKPISDIEECIIEDRLINGRRK